MGAVLRILWFLGGVAVAALFIGLWQAVCALGLVSPIFLPPPMRVWHALADGFLAGDSAAMLGATVARVYGGWIIASVIGIALGALIGVSAKARIYIAPSLEVLRPLPVSALVPIFIGLFGFTEQMVLSVIAFGALWPTLLNTVHGFSAVEPRLYEVAETLRMPRLAVIAKIALPSALPDILAGMRVGLTVSLILVVVGEILGSREGLGYNILLAQRSYKSADLFAGIILLGMVGYLSSLLINALEKRLVYWR
jgi:ABC-type nitrate/sulfonate/bicarbonate transport system permease component